MKKLSFLIAGLAFLCSGQSASAQSEFETGTNIVQATIGFPQLLGFGTTYKTTIPAIGLAYDRGIIDDLINGKASVGVGAYFGIAGARQEFIGFGYDYTYILAGARGTFHYELLEDFDTYAGVLLGATVVASNGYGNAPFSSVADGSGLLSGAFVGGRYYFTDDFAAVAELGFGVALLNVGISARF